MSLCTVRLVSENSGGGQSVGTGYFYTFTETRGDEFLKIPVLVTNKHVVNGAVKITGEIRIFPRENVIHSHGSADGEIMFPLTFTPTEGLDLIVMHPDPEVDLCAIPMASLFIPGLLPDGYIHKLSFIDERWLLTPEEEEFLRPIESIIMVGYPDGLWDEVNNRPIARRGLTASHALRRWNDKRQFVIDAACFPGSSGSPVFLYEDGLFRVATGYTPGVRAKLLGTLFAGPMVTREGIIEIRDIPTAGTPVPVTSMMMNLGFCVHASALAEIHEVIKEREKT